MDTSVQTPLEPVLAVMPVHRFTADQYLEMIQTGILTEDDHVELINGVITEMAPSNPDHTWGVQRLNRLFMPVADKYYLFIQGTIVVDGQHVFDPDAALVKLSAADERPLRNPRATEVDLVIETADSSLDKDRGVKALAYAAAGIPEYWILDLKGSQVWVHRDPIEGTYQSINSKRADQQVSPLCYPKLVLTANKLLGA